MKDKLLSILAEQIGVEVDDINLEDSLRDDLHMSSVELTEFAENLSSAGIGPVDLAQIDTVEELIEVLNLEDL